MSIGVLKYRKNINFSAENHYIFYLIKFEVNGYEIEVDRGL